MRLVRQRPSSWRVAAAGRRTPDVNDSRAVNRWPARRGGVAGRWPSLPVDPARRAYWPQWRGPLATGVSTRADPPAEWSETKNVRWKIEIPGRGSGSPVVWGDRLFVLTAVPKGVDAAAAHEPRGMMTPRLVHRYVVMAINRKDGKVAVGADRARGSADARARTRTTAPSPRAPRSPTAQHVIASFESQGLYAYDMNGTPVWRRTSATSRCATNSAKAPRRCCTAAISSSSGITRASRSSSRSTSRPVGDLARQAGRDRHLGDAAGGRARAARPQVVTSGMNKLRSYDLETGALVWETAGVTMNPIPSPVADRRDGVRDERLPRQQPQGHPARRREGRDHRRPRARMVGRSRHAVRALAAPVRGHHLFSEDELRACSRRSTRRREAALSGAAAGRRAERVLVAGRRRRPHLHRRAAKGRRRCSNRGPASS